MLAIRDKDTRKTRAAATEHLHTTAEVIRVSLTEDGESQCRSTIPFVATATSSPNCLNCLKVAEGAVLGVVTKTM